MSICQDKMSNQGQIVLLALPCFGKKDMTLYNLNLACQHIELEENLKYWKQTKNLKKLDTLSHIFVCLGTVIMILLNRNVHVLVSQVSLPVSGLIGAVLKCRVLESEWFCTGNPIYRLLTLTHPYWLLRTN